MSYQCIGYVFLFLTTYGSSTPISHRSAYSTVILKFPYSVRCTDQSVSSAEVRLRYFFFDAFFHAVTCLPIVASKYMRLDCCFQLIQRLSPASLTISLQCSNSQMKSVKYASRSLLNIFALTMNVGNEIAILIHSWPTVCFTSLGKFFWVSITAWM